VSVPSHRARNKNPEVTLCTVLAEILKDAREIDAYNNWFGQPVPKSVAADYDTYIKRRMDLSMIQLNCRFNKYRSRREFLDDFRQIAANALQYNGPTTGMIYAKASELRNKAVELVNRRTGELEPAEQALETWISPEGEDKTSEMERDTKAVARAKAALPDHLRFTNMDTESTAAAAAAAALVASAAALVASAPVAAAPAPAPENDALPALSFN
jgi:hypothetical protein